MDSGVAIRHLGCDLPKGPTKRSPQTRTLTTRVEWFFIGLVSQGLGTLDIEVHNNRFLAASDDHSLTRHIGPGVDFLMRNVRRNINEISRIGFVAEL